MTRGEEEVLLTMCPVEVIADGSPGRLSPSAWRHGLRCPAPGGGHVKGQHPLRGPCLSSPALPLHRQHFPFFRTAPEGWKNTVRHNLCFRHAFEKVPVSTQGGAGTGPRSCLWKLTEEGHRRFKEEARGLVSAQLETIQQCMSQPGVSPCQPAGCGPGLDTLT